MKNIAGSPVEGENFFGREKEFEYAWQRILDGNNIVIPSPRRVGKTSFAKKLLKKAEDTGWQTLEINLEEVTNEIEFIELFIAKLKEEGSWWEKAKDKGGKLLEKLKALKPAFEVAGAKVAVEWQANKRDVYEHLGELLDHNQNTVIFLDELTVLLSSIIKQENGYVNTESFLHWLRSLRQVSQTKIRWVFCSSVGIENFTHTYGISATLNDIPDFALKAFDAGTSKAMLEKLEAGNDLVLTEAIRNKIVSKLSYCLPFFLQIIFEKIKYLKEIEDIPLNEKIVDAAYNVLIEGKHFNTWIERIEKQYGVHQASAFILLRHICQHATGVTRVNLINLLSAVIDDNEKAEAVTSNMLYMLKNDGYLAEENSLYFFRSPLLRDFWLNRYVK
jgi:uncharacterized protein